MPSMPWSPFGDRTPPGTTHFELGGRALCWHGYTRTPLIERPGTRFPVRFRFNETISLPSRNPAETIDNYLPSSS